MMHCDMHTINQASGQHFKLGSSEFLTFKVAAYSSLESGLTGNSSSDPASTTKTTYMKESTEPAEFYNAGMLTQAGSKGPQIDLKFKI